MNAENIEQGKIESKKLPKNATFPNTLKLLDQLENSETENKAQDALKMKEEEIRNIGGYEVKINKDEQKFSLKIDDTVTIRVEYVDGEFNFYENTEGLLTEGEYGDIDLQGYEMLQGGEGLKNVNNLNKIIKLYYNPETQKTLNNIDDLRKLAEVFMGLELAALEKQFDKEVSQATDVMGEDLHAAQDKLKNMYDIK